ncbi:restriction endonuclease subunit S [Bradyrhizobium sp. AZCC 2289]|uniref:restriction endonuclease subunit S n=1 Tax=Bradyrhizobium sp. AZCC 2289 TaxID=3117026 RepID=UPI002FF21B44
MKDIQDGRVLSHRLAKTNVSEDELASYRLRCGDLLINRTNSLDQVGKVGLVHADRDDVFASYLVRLNVNTDLIEPEYLNYWLNSDLAQRTIKRIATPAIGQANLNPTELQKYCLVPIPPAVQRKRIVEVLRKWDEAIDTTDRLIVAKRSNRDYHYRNLVSWSRCKTVPIGSVVEAVARPVPTPKTAYKALGLRSHGKGTFQRIIERPEEIDMETVYVVGPHDLIVNITFAWEGAIALAQAEDAGCFVSHRFPTFEVKEDRVNRDFLGYAVGSRRFFHNLGIASPGGAGRNRVLNKTAFLKLEIPFPPKPEQDRIARYLLELDKEIEILKSYRAAIEKQRRGLLQNLLTGQWSMPVRDSDVDAAAARVTEEAAQ